MAVPTCGTCRGHAFEIALVTPVGQSYRLQMVICAQCGAAAGILDPNLELRIARLSEQVAEIDERMARISQTLSD